jgi:hypothetical protein
MSRDARTIRRYLLFTYRRVFDVQLSDLQLGGYVGHFEHGSARFVFLAEAAVLLSVIEA